MWSRLSPRARRNTLRIVPFGLIWFLVDQVFTVSDRATAASSGVTSTVIDVDLGIYLFASVAVAAVGCLVGAIELLYLNRRLASLSLGSKLVAKTLFYAALLACVVLVTFPIAVAMEMDTGLADSRVWERLRGFLISGASLGTGVELTASLVVVTDLRGNQRAPGASGPDQPPDGALPHPQGGAAGLPLLGHEVVHTHRRTAWACTVL